ncbi:NUDIX hydrolase [Oricola nitratireducens]|jgi:ADP-ribose pyrophosphatase YjhB (NUDIX family)|uniref:NUDIX hydrolase n=1 Tax=Oricola nitratireducens TaxID=2775868 RepID=UPI0018675848|nr:NUDIX hydrolase [Oricola nitratireducens]
MTKPKPTPLIAVSVAARNPETGEFLLVLRGRPPAKDLWAFPGGRLDFGETLEQAVRRELFEETGLEARDVCFHTLLEIIGNDSGDEPPHHFVLAVHRATVSGDPDAGDDAAEAGWFSLADMASLDITETTLAVAREIAAAT